MPQVQLVPQVAPLWDQVLFWPPRAGLLNTVTTTVSQFSGRSGVINTSTVQLVAIAPGTGGVTGFQRHSVLLIPGYRQTFVGPGTAGTLIFTPMQLPLVYAAADIAPGVIMPEVNRFHWFRIYFDIRGAAAPTVETGWAFLANGTGNWYGTAFCPKIGVVGDGAGGLQWRVETNAGALVEAVPIAGFVTNKVNLLEFLVLNSAPGRNASVALRLNGTVLLSRNWLVAPALPRSGTLNTEGPYTLQSHIKDVNVEQWTFHIEYRSGAYTDTGVQVDT